MKKRRDENDSLDAMLGPLSANDAFGAAPRFGMRNVVDEFGLPVLGADGKPLQERAVFFRFKNGGEEEEVSYSLSGQGDKMCANRSSARFRVHVAEADGVSADLALDDSESLIGLRH